MPAKAPRSESEDSSLNRRKMPPEKPRRRSREHGFPTNPEPYSSQRSYRKITDQHVGLNARLSPSSNSEDEARGYRLPFDNLSTENHSDRKAENCEISTENWESKTVKSSSSDYCLSGNFRRGNMLYQSDRTMERSANLRLRGSFSSEIIGDSYYENLRTASDSRDDFLDSYDKLLEIHQDTVKQIAEATVFKCDCKELQGTDWNDFEIRGKMLNYGISSYVTVPVTLRRGGKNDKYTAWVSLFNLVSVMFIALIFVFDRFQVTFTCLAVSFGHLNTRKAYYCCMNAFRPKIRQFLI